MPRPGKRSRTKRHVQKALPGGATKTTYRAKGNARPRCSICGQLLAGGAQLSALKATKLNRSRRRTWRVYGGQLCHNCVKIGLKQAARTC